MSDIREKIQKIIKTEYSLEPNWRTKTDEEVANEILSIVREAVSEAPADMEQWTHTHTPRASDIDRSGCRACIQEQAAKDYYDVLMDVLS